MKKLLKRGIILVIVVSIYCFSINEITKILSEFGLEEYRLIKDYLAIILSWSVAFLLVSLIFIFKFSDSIKQFLKNLGFIKFGPVEAGRIQEEPNKGIEKKVTKSLEKQDITPNQLKQFSKEKEEKDNVIRYYQERSGIYEFAYLSLFLVYNSKQALLWFYNQFSHSSTKENFTINFLFPFLQQIPNPRNEKEKIFSILLSNQLITPSNGLYIISEKGKSFLRYIGYIR